VQAENSWVHTVLFGLNMRAVSALTFLPFQACVAPLERTQTDTFRNGAIQSAGKRAWPWTLVYLKCIAIGQISEPASEPASAHNDMLCAGGECMQAPGS
jgi:hypothetical protein